MNLKYTTAADAPFWVVSFRLILTPNHHGDICEYTLIEWFNSIPNKYKNTLNSF